MIMVVVRRWSTSRAARRRATAGVVLVCLALAACQSPESERRLAQFLGQEPPASAPLKPDTGPVGAAPEAEAPVAGAEPTVLQPPTGEPAAPGLTGPEIYPGSPAAAPTARESVAVGEQGEVTLSFVDADVREVIHTVLGEVLGLNYVVDPRIQGTVTLHTMRPIPRASVLGVLEDALAMNGAALIESEGAYKIIPLDQAITTPSILRGYPDPVRMDRGFGLHVIPLRYTSAAALQEVLEQFVPPGHTLRVDPARNVVIFVGTGPEAREIQDLVETFDVDWMAGMSFGMFPVRYADPKTIIGELEQVFAREGPAAGLVHFVAIDRLDAILVITPQLAYLEQAQNWISRLDRGEASDRRQLYVYYVQNGRATELADVLGQVFGIAVATAAEEAQLAPGLRSTEIGRAGEEPLLADGESPETFGTELDRQYSEPALPRQAPDGGAAPPSGPPQLGGEAGGLRIVADARNNALVINATPAEYEILDAALQKLDIVPLQVLIEATIAEVTLNDRLEYGLQWFFRAGNNTFTFSTAETGTVTPSFPGFAYVLGTNDVRVVLSALTEITDVKVISSPQLLVLDNEVARLQVGDEVPIISRTSTSVIDPDAPVVNEVEYRDTGVILDIVPRVNAGGLVVLDILQEVSDVVATETSAINSPTIQQRRIASTVAINSGETVALGGLIRDNNTNAVTGVPLLSDIPILGNLFKTTVDSVRRTELLILLSPRVVRDRNDARIVTEELRKRLRALDPLAPKIE